MPKLKVNPQQYGGSAFFSGAFRPFFLGAAIWAVCAIGLWLYVLGGAGDYPVELTSTSWHSHEMIFGFAGAALAGFILTAMPNWTGRSALKGRPLMILALLWLLGRLAILAAAFIGAPWISLFDIPFLFALLFVVWRDITMTKNKRNYPVVYLFAALACANVFTHAESLGIAWLDGHGWRFGLGTIVLLLSFIGGRIIPNFTRNWLRQNLAGNASQPKPPSALDTYVLWLNLLALCTWVFVPDNLASGALLIIAGLAQVLRLSRWCGLQTVRASVVVVLHIGYAWIGLGLIILGASVLWAGVGSSAALHALTIGGVGTMTAAVMSRASLGHSGKQIKAGLGLSLVYTALSLATLTRLAAGFGSEYYLLLINLSGALWIAAFSLFAILFAPLYFKPRV